MKHIVYLLCATLMQPALATDGDIQAFVEKNHQQMAEQGWTINNDGTASNSKTGLTWKRCLEGQTLEGNTCSGERKKYTWYEATQLKSSFAGKSDWRLPTIDELSGIVYCSEGRRPVHSNKDGRLMKVNGVLASGECLGDVYQSPTANLFVFPTLEKYALYSDSPVATSNDIWTISFYEGLLGSIDKTWNYPLSVRLVRGQ